MAITIKKSSSGATFSVSYDPSSIPNVFPVNSCVFVLSDRIGYFSLLNMGGVRAPILEKHFSEIVNGDTGTAFTDLTSVKTYIETNFFRKAATGGGGNPGSGSISSAIPEWTSGHTFNIDEPTTVSQGDGTYKLYRSSIDNNTALNPTTNSSISPWRIYKNPASAPVAYDAGVTYANGALALFNAGPGLDILLLSKQDNNLNNAFSDPAWWSIEGIYYGTYNPATNYTIYGGQYKPLVLFSGAIYISDVAVTGGLPIVAPSWTFIKVSPFSTFDPAAFHLDSTGKFCIGSAPGQLLTEYIQWVKGTTSTNSMNITLDSEGVQFLVGTAGKDQPGGSYSQLNLNPTSLYFYFNSLVQGFEGQKSINLSSGYGIVVEDTISKIGFQYGSQDFFINDPRWVASKQYVDTKDIVMFTGTASGDGTTLEFIIDFIPPVIPPSWGIPFAPSMVIATGNSNDSLVSPGGVLAFKSTILNDTQVKVTYIGTAPIAGTNNIQWTFLLK